MVVWSGKHAARFIEQPPSIKIQPAGVDVGVSEVWRISSGAVATLDGETRKVVPSKQLVKPGLDGFYSLRRGVYEVRLANKITVPSDAAVFVHPRSTLNRLGMLKSETGVWDPGYSGYGTQTVYVPISLYRIHVGEMWFQVVFMDAEAVGEAYRGHWQGEKPVR